MDFIFIYQVAMRTIIACIQFHSPIGQVQVQLGATAEGFLVARERHEYQTTHSLLRRDGHPLLRFARLPRAGLRVHLAQNLLQQILAAQAHAVRHKERIFGMYCGEWVQLLASPAHIEGQTHKVNRLLLAAGQVPFKANRRVSIIGGALLQHQDGYIGHNLQYAKDTTSESIPVVSTCT